MIIQADEHVILIARTVVLEAVLGKALGAVGDFANPSLLPLQRVMCPLLTRQLTTTACSHILVPKFSLSTNLAKKALDLRNQKIWPNLQKFSLLKV